MNLHAKIAKTTKIVVMLVCFGLVSGLVYKVYQWRQTRIERRSSHQEKLSKMLEESSSLKKTIEEYIAKDSGQDSKTQGATKVQLESLLLIVNACYPDNRMSIWIEDNNIARDAIISIQSSVQGKRDQSFTKIASGNAGSMYDTLSLVVNVADEILQKINKYLSANPLNSITNEGFFGDFAEFYSTLAKKYENRISELQKAGLEQAGDLNVLSESSSIMEKNSILLILKLKQDIKAKIAQLSQ